MENVYRKLDGRTIAVLKNGGIGVIPTDTIYGLVGQALEEKTVEKIYKIRRRHPQKPFIILISSLSELKLFDIALSNEQEEFLAKNWPDKISIVLECLNSNFSYLHRGTKTLAFRMPEKKEFRELLKKTGPLVAPSANWEGGKPAKNIKEAKEYFGHAVDFYVDAGEISGEPSTLIKLQKDGKYDILRQGAIYLKLDELN